MNSFFAKMIFYIKSIFGAESSQIVDIHFNNIGNKKGNCIVEKTNGKKYIVKWAVSQNYFSKFFSTYKLSEQIFAKYEDEKLYPRYLWNEKENPIFVRDEYCFLVYEYLEGEVINQYSESVNGIANFHKIVLDQPEILCPKKRNSKLMDNMERIISSRDVIRNVEKAGDKLDLDINKYRREFEVLFRDIREIIYQDRVCRQLCYGDLNKDNFLKTKYGISLFDFDDIYYGMHVNEIVYLLKLICNESDVNIYQCFCLYSRTRKLSEDELRILKVLVNPFWILFCNQNWEKNNNRIEMFQELYENI